MFHVLTLWVHLKQIIHTLDGDYDYDDDDEAEICLKIILLF
jgi:hypothetical protein